MGSWLRRHLLPAALAIASVACFGSGPCSMFPGSRIEGTPTRPPETWEFLGAGKQCALEVKPEAPKSVHIDCYTYQGQLYVHSHRWARTPRLWGEAWVTAAERDPNVRLVIEGQVYELHAQLVSKQSLRRRVLLARGFDPVPEGIQLFALEQRPGG
jgi:hypothetical protein